MCIVHHQGPQYYVEVDIFFLRWGAMVLAGKLERVAGHRGVIHGSAVRAEEILQWVP